MKIAPVAASIMMPSDSLINLFFKIRISSVNVLPTTKENNVVAGDRNVFLLVKKAKKNS